MTNPIPGLLPAPTPAARRGGARASIGLGLGLALAGCGKNDKPAGDGAATTGAPGTAPTPKATPFGVAALATGYYNSYALMTDGTVRGWGQAQHGQLGTNDDLRARDTAKDAATPVAVPGVAEVAALVAGHGSTGNAGTTVFAITRSGKVYAWGASDLMPTASKKNEPRPVEVPGLAGARQIALGLGHACARRADGTVACWGSGYSGEMGTGGKDSNDTPQPVPGLADVEALAAGASHTCALIKGGTVRCWGENGSRQVDPATTEDQRAPVAVPGISGAVAVAASDDYSCAVDGAGQLTCWGDSAAAPAVVLTGVASVAGGYDHLCALMQDGAVRCWGDNDNGELGQGELNQPSSSREPLAVKGVQGATAVSCGYEHCCAVVAAGAEVRCWGSNKFGALGDGTLADAGAPVVVKDVAAVALPAPATGFGTARVGAPQTWADLPKGCVHAEALDLGYEPFKVLHQDRFEIKGASAERARSGTITVTLSNYAHRTAAGATIQPRGDQLMAIAYFLKYQDPKANPKVQIAADVGDYVYQDDAPRQFGAMSGLVTPHMSVLFRDGLTDGGTMTLTHVDDAWVCGRFALAGAQNGKPFHLTGTFAAPLPPAT